jgi:hypothetical protein
MDKPSLDKSLSETPSERRLDSWKEIALYLHRDVTTVQRWRSRRGCLSTGTYTTSEAPSTP